MLCAYKNNAPVAHAAAHGFDSGGDISLSLRGRPYAISAEVTNGIVADGVSGGDLGHANPPPHEYTFKADTELPCPDFGSHPHRHKAQKNDPKQAGQECQAARTDTGSLGLLVREKLPKQQRRDNNRRNGKRHPEASEQKPLPLTVVCLCAQPRYRNKPIVYCRPAYKL